MSRREQADATREALVATARRLFAEHGYAGTSTGMVLAELGLARGALYHHFPDKRSLLAAAYEAVEADLVARVAGAAFADPDRPLWDSLVVGVRTFLAAAAAGEVQRIVLTDGPAVLGRAAWRELDERYGLGLVRSILATGIAAGVFAERPVDPLARLLLAALNEAASEVAQADDPSAALDEVAAAVLGLFAALRADAGAQ